MAMEVDSYMAEMSFWRWIECFSFLHFLFIIYLIAFDFKDSRYYEDLISFFVSYGYDFFIIGASLNETSIDLIVDSLFLFVFWVLFSIVI